MAETLISPGVLARENDSSFITQQPVTVGAAIIGPTARGPVEVPTVVTTYSQYQNLFGTTFTSASMFTHTSLLLQPITTFKTEDSLYWLLE